MGLQSGYKRNATYNATNETARRLKTTYAQIDPSGRHLKGRPWLATARDQEPPRGAPRHAREKYAIHLRHDRHECKGHLIHWCGALKPRRAKRASPSPCGRSSRARPEASQEVHPSGKGLGPGLSAHQQRAGLTSSRVPLHAHRERRIASQVQTEGSAYYAERFLASALYAQGGPKSSKPRQLVCSPPSARRTTCIH